MAKSETSKNEKVKKSTTSKIKLEKETTKKKTAKATTTKKAVNKKETTPKATSKKSATTKSTTKKSTTKKSSATKDTTKKATSKSTAKKTTTKKKTSPKKRTTSRSKKNTIKKATPNIIEYYDLPNTYNQTTVKLLFQTPKKLFVYWEISEADKQKFFEEKGNDFFETTTPFLVVRNKTKNYTFEVEINDFANSWYFDVPDSNCDYEVELIRKHKVTKSTTWITTSNNLEVPNNRILFDKNRKEIFFKNVKTNVVISKTVVNLQFINHLGKVYNANSFYKKFYKEEDLVEMNNPTSFL